MYQNTKETINFWVKTILIVLGCILSWLIYGFGLIAPLTPSEGHPNLVTMLIFIGIPLVILFLCWYASEDFWAKLAIILQAALIVGFYTFSFPSHVFGFFS